MQAMPALFGDEGRVGFIHGSDRSVRGTRQMGKAIFFAIARNPKLQARIAKLRRAAGYAFVERLIVAPRLDLEALPAAGDFFSLPEPLDRLGTKKDQIITERGDEGEPIGIRLGHERENQKGSVDPG